MITQTNINDVHLLESLFSSRAKINKDYLMELNSTALLQNYYIEACLAIPGQRTIDSPENSNIHWGWESPVCQLRGHFLGHFLSAAAMLVATDNDAELKAKLNAIIDELEKCQKSNGGKWLAPFSEKYFSKLESGEYIWSPQYTMHKLIMGLLHANIYAGNRKALSILGNLADWYIKWTDRVLKSPVPEAINRGEQGGMIEVWAELFNITGRPKFKTLADRYANPLIFKSLLEDKDPLTNAHQNASIPFIQGSAKMYEVTGEKQYLEIVEKFWKCAVGERETYCTGGQGSGEFWTPPHNAGQFIGERNQELNYHCCWDIPLT